MLDRPTAELERIVAGEVLGPDDPGYDAARTVWNGRFDSRPAVIVRAGSPDDVRAVVGFARTTGTALTVKGNGHSYAGVSAADGGILLDLRPMAAISVDAAARVVSVEPGATWGEVDAATQAHGLATPGGTVSSVGVSGLSLGGGEGWLQRVHGLTIDNLRAVEVVTAAGDVVRAAEDEHADLFWALRGGGGNFGIVTRFEYGLHAVGPELLAGQVLYPGSRAAEVLRAYRDYFITAPPEATGYAFFLRIPPIDAFPTSLHGQLVIDLVLCYVGPIGDGERALAPLRGLGDPIADTVGPVPFVGLQQAFDAGVGPGNRWYTRGSMFDELTDPAIDALVGGLEPFPGEFTLVYLGPGGGAVGRIPTDGTAYPHRTAAFSLHVWPGWVDAAADASIMGWARALHGAVQPHANGGVYVNLLAEDEADRVPAAFGPNYERLTRLKAAWDPGNLFRHNHNIPPAG